jgi:hypothetical protein
MTYSRAAGDAKWITLPKRTLGDIVSVKQSGIGRQGLKDLIKKYGL